VGGHVVKRSGRSPEQPGTTYNEKVALGVAWLEAVASDLLNSDNGY